MNSEEPQKLFPMSDHDLLITLNSSVNSLREDVKTAMGNVSIQTTDHEARLRTLETDNNSFKGTIGGLKWAMAVLGAIVGVVEPFILYYISRG